MHQEGPVQPGDDWKRQQDLRFAEYLGELPDIYFSRRGDGLRRWPHGMADVERLASWVSSP